MMKSTLEEDGEFLMHISLHAMITTLESSHLFPIQLQYNKAMLVYKRVCSPLEEQR
jgi:hypothetical protein